MPDQNLTHQFIAYAGTGLQFQSIQTDAETIANADSAMRTIYDLNRFEEYYHLTIRSHNTLELTMLSNATDLISTSFAGWREGAEFLFEIVQHTMGYLTASRAYFDSICRTLKHSDTLSSSLDSFKTATHNAFDACRYYRLAEGLRNYSQHQGMPVHSSHIGTKNMMPGELGPLRYSTTGTVFLSEIWGDLKAKYRNGFTETEEIDLRRITRSHLTGLSSCHASLRESTDKILSASLGQIDSLLSDAEKLVDEPVSFVKLIAIRPEGGISREIGVHRPPAESVESSRKHLLAPVNFDRSFVDNSLTSD